MENKTVKYKRVLLKLSGEALAGEAGTGLDFNIMKEVCSVIAQCVAEGIEVGIVVGGGNFWRGLRNGDGKMERARADYMGMMATVMNSLAVQDVLIQCGVDAKVMTALSIQSVGETFDAFKADEYLKSGKAVIFACGTGAPYFSTDTGAVLRAALIHADAILLAKNVDGCYSADPKKDPNAVRYDSLSFDEVLSRHLGVMDSTATCLAMDNGLPVFVFALKDPENILRAVYGEAIGTEIR